MNKSLRWIASALVLLICIAAWSWKDETTESQAKDGLARALEMHAISRGLNAVVAVAQGTRVQVQMGVGAELAVGEALQPVHDMIEQFAAAMLAAAAVFGMQLLLIKLGSSMLLNALLTIAAAITLALWWGRGAVPRVSVHVLALLVLVRFAVPVSVVASGWTHETMLKQDYDASVEQLKSTDAYRRSATVDPADSPASASPEADDATAAKAKAPGGLLNRIGSAFQSVKDAAANVGASVGAMRDDLFRSADKLAKSMVSIAVQLLLQTLILPLLFGAALISITRALTRSLLAAGSS